MLDNLRAIKHIIEAYLLMAFDSGYKEDSIALSIPYFLKSASHIFG